MPAADVLIVAGLHVPAIPLFEIDGNASAVLFWHSGPICVNVGMVCAFTVMLSVVEVAHWPFAGVNV